MEDLDQVREVPGAGADILATLSAFGLESDEAVVYQSRRSHLYAQALASLQARGRVYPCACSRSDLAAFGGIHPDHCVTELAEARHPPSWRLRVGHGEIAFQDAVYGGQTQDVGRQVGDFVLRRADGGYTYQLAVVVDDADQRISAIVRGADLLESTPRQILLQRQLGLEEPTYAHLPLVVDAAGRKLSKHDRSRPVDPSDPVPALRAALEFLGQSVPGENGIHALLRAAIDRFDIMRIRPGGAFDAAMQKD